MWFLEGKKMIESMEGVCVLDLLSHEVILFYSIKDYHIGTMEDTPVYQFTT